MANRQNPLSAEAQRALDLLRRTGETDWFIFDAMEVVADGGVELPQKALEELGRAGLGRIYDGNRRFALTTDARATATSSVEATAGDATEGSDAEGDGEEAGEDAYGRVPAAQLADEAAAAGDGTGSEDDDLEPAEDDESAPADVLTDDDIDALAEWEGGDSTGSNGNSHGRSASVHFQDQDLLNRVLVELLAMQLARQEGIPGDPSETIYAHLTTGPAATRKANLTLNAVREAIALCQKRGWLRPHRDVLLRLIPRARFIAFRLAPGRFSALGGEVACEYDDETGAFTLVD